MATLKRWVEQEAAGEPILAVVTNGEFTNLPAGEVLEWNAVVVQLAEAFHDGYGGHNCDAIWAYTATKVIAIAVYDGSTWAYSIPRNPTDGIIPAMEGGE